MNNSTPEEEGQKKPLRISAEMMDSAEVKSVVNQLQEAKKVPLVREIGVPEKSGGPLKSIAWLLGAGLVGGLLTWVAWQILFPIFQDDDDSTLVNVVASASAAVLVGLLLVVGDVLKESAFSKFPQRLAIGMIAAVIFGLGLGLAASALYNSGFEQIYDDLVASGLSPGSDEFFEQLLNRNQLNRGLAWSFVGLAAGLTIGISALQWKRALLTGGGGIVGGFIGGYLFDILPSENVSQIVGLLITGLAIGGVIALTEEAAKTSWIEITHGGMAGKQFILYQRTITLGSAPKADITLIKDETVPGLAAVLEKKGSGATVSATDPSGILFVNGVETSHASLQDGDSISMGKTALRFRERGQKAVKSGVVRS